MAKRGVRMEYVYCCRTGMHKEILHGLPFWKQHKGYTYTIHFNSISRYTLIKTFELENMTMN